MERRAQRILLVDDDPHVLESIGESLRRYHHDVTTVASLAAARAVLADGVTPAFELIVTDVRLADGSGLQLAHEVLANLAPRPRLLVISGYLDDPQLTALLVNGNAEVLLKPFPLRTLLQHVDGPVQTQATSGDPAHLASA